MRGLSAFLAYAADAGGPGCHVLHQTVMRDLTVGDVRAAAAAIHRLQAENARLKQALPACPVCEGSGYIDHDAVLTGPYPHSACREQCEACAGTGAEL